MTPQHPLTPTPLPSVQSPMSDAFLLRPVEAARVLAISPRKLWELSNTREIPSLRIGRCLRYSPEHLRAWIAARGAQRT